MTRALVCGLLCTLGMINGPKAQRLATEVYPSEDELVHALIIGELSFEEYELLVELLTLGIDSLDAYLFDFVPNLPGIENADTSLGSLEREQRNPFLMRALPPHGQVEYGYSRQLDDDPAAGERYRTAGRISMSEHLSAEARWYREYTGRERFVSRRVSYRSGSGLVRDITVGTYRTQFGLGTVFGYRGKLLGAYELDETASLVIPDYGGFNGTLAEVAFGRQQVSFGASHIRDNDHSLTTTAMMWTPGRRPVTPALVFGVNHLKERHTDRAANQYSVAANAHIPVTEGKLNVEGVIQTGDQRAAFGFVGEGSMSLPDVRIRFAGWWYDDDFADYSSGSRRATLGHEDTVDAIGLTYTNQRAGQYGALARTHLGLDHGWTLNTAIVAAMQEGDARLEGSMEVEKTISHGVSFGLDYIGRVRDRGDGDSTPESDRQKVRLVIRYKGEGLTARLLGGLGYDDGDRYGEILATARYVSPGGTRVHGWFNLTRIDGSGIRSWYAYGQVDHELLDPLTAEVKFSYTYARGLSRERRPAISATVAAAW